MSWSPEFQRADRADGGVEVRLGHPVVDLYLEFLAVVLLRGLVSSGDVFGAAYDQLASTHRLVVPDLLGFGRSMDTNRSAH